MFRDFLHSAAHLLVAAGAASCARGLEGKPCPCVDDQRYICCDGVCESAALGCAASDPGAAGVGAPSASSALEMTGAGGARSGPEPRTDPRASLVGSAGSSSSSAGRSPVLLSLPSPTPSSSAGVLVATHQYDAERSGANLAEALLTTRNVNAATFGRLATRAVRGGVYAQPLYVPELELPGIGRRNVMFVATLRNYVYALDADDASAPPYWVRELGPARPGAPFVSEMGIVGTPVISSSEHALYVVAAVHAGGSMEHRLHKLSLETGDERVPLVRVEDPAFDSAVSGQLSALSLAHGNIYVAFGQILLDEGGQGLLLAYDAATLERAGSLSELTAQRLGPVWMSGQGPAFDGEFMYLAADAPDTFSAPDAFGSRLLKIRPSAAASLGAAPSATASSAASALGVEDWFLPSYVRTHGWSELGSTGPLVIPGSDRLVLAGNRAVYVLDRNALGNYQPDDAEIVQKFELRSVGSACTEGSACNRVYAAPILWDREHDPRLYLWAQNDVPRSFVFDRNAGRFACGSEPALTCAPLAEGVTTTGVGSTQAMALSANAEAEGSGILWALADARLRALDADSLSPLWTSLPGALGPTPAKLFAAPVITGGRVFVPSLDGLSEQAQWSDPLLRGGPALAVHEHTASLVAAWRGGAAEGVSVSWSTDGRTWSEPRALLEQAAHDPALASDAGSRLFLSLVDRSGRVRVLAADEPSFSQPSELSLPDATGIAAPLSAVSASAPALAFGGGMLFLAWRTAAGDAINVLASADRQTFDLQSSLALEVESSDTPFALCWAQSKLYLMLQAADSALRMLESSDGGRTFRDAGSFLANARGRPALVDLGWPALQPAESYLFWLDAAATPTLNVRRGDSPSSLLRATALAYPRDGRTLSAATFAGRVYVAWNEGLTIHVSRYTPGEVAVFGLQGAGAAE